MSILKFNGQTVTVAGYTNVIDYSPFSFNVSGGNGFTFTMPTVFAGTYNYHIEWGDGEISPDISVWDDANRSHTYTNAGEYTINIIGQYAAFN